MITVKNSRNGLEFWLDDTKTYAELRDALAEKLRTNRHFYSGTTQPVYFFGKHCSPGQKRELRSLLSSEFSIKDVRFTDDEIPQKQKTTSMEMPQITEEPQKPEPQQVIIKKENSSVFLRHTVRGGQRVESEGDIVVVGDVNPGAELVAGGSIAVFGNLRGLAHAGASGRKDVCIVANALLPRQVRICGKIALIPKGRHIDCPEIVTLENDEVIVRNIG